MNKNSVIDEYFIKKMSNETVLVEQREVTENVELQTFSNELFGEIRTVVIDDEPWFVLVDICRSLGLTNSSVVAGRLDEDERRKFNLPRQGNTHIVNESGLYKVIFRSDKPEAKIFTKWVTSEILPTIRKHGMYATDEKLNNPDLLIQVAIKLKEERERNNLLILENKKKDERIEHLIPHATFSKEFLKSDGTVKVGILAKHLCKLGVPIGRNRLFKYLKQHKYISYEDGYNIPTQKSINLGIMELEEKLFYDKEGNLKNGRVTKINPKGMKYFYRKLSSKKIASA